MTEPLLRIEDLHVTFSTRRGLVEAVRGVTLSLEQGEMLGLVGESGSGKSVTGFATTRLLDPAGRVTAGRILLRGQDITKIPDSDFRGLHGAAMSMIFQNPRAALNPIRAVGLQIADAILSHKRLSKEEAADQALKLLRAVQIRDPEKRMTAYPHELSGGMCQRVMIAIAISCNPMLLIADEPTTGLDVTTQQTVMELLARIKAERGMAMILITHDLGLADRDFADRGSGGRRGEEPLPGDAGGVQAPAGAAAGHPTAARCEKSREALRSGAAGGSRFLHDHGGRRECRAGRRIRLRQDHDVAHDLPAD
jgi:peptide/nickel transport system ATP-binding protein